MLYVYDNYIRDAINSQVEGRVVEAEAFGIEGGVLDSTKVISAIVSCR